mmetsp:Transcript_1855/g.5202  ORF Transcript_1855/g.5202 Transcript_1855/m.5202 type:complete len:99 (-) Transcript_1855:1108-1404(-)
MRGPVVVTVYGICWCLAASLCSRPSPLKQGGLLEQKAPSSWRTTASDDIGVWSFPLALGQTLPRRLSRSGKVFSQSYFMLTVTENFAMQRSQQLDARC